MIRDIVDQCENVVAAYDITEKNIHRVVAIRKSDSKLCTIDTMDIEKDAPRFGIVRRNGQVVKWHDNFVDLKRFHDSEYTFKLLDIVSPI